MSGSNESGASVFAAATKNAVNSEQILVSLEKIIDEKVKNMNTDLFEYQKKLSDSGHYPGDVSLKFQSSSRGPYINIQGLQIAGVPDHHQRETNLFFSISPDGKTLTINEQLGSHFIDSEEEAFSEPAGSEAQIQAMAAFVLREVQAEAISRLSSSARESLKRQMEAAEVPNAPNVIGVN